MKAVRETSQPKQTNAYSSLLCLLNCLLKVDFLIYFFSLESWCAGLISAIQLIHDASLEADSVFQFKVTPGEGHDVMSHGIWRVAFYKLLFWLPRNPLTSLFSSELHPSCSLSGGNSILMLSLETSQTTAH